MIPLAGGPAALPWLQILGWTLLHSLWQGTLVALLLAGLLRATRRAPAALRYALACVALAVTAGLAVATATSMRADWAEHQACWRQPPRPGALPDACASHGILPREHRERYEALSRSEEIHPAYAASLRLTGPLAWGGALWMGAAALLLLRTGVALRRASRLRTEGARALRGEVAESLAALRASLGVERAVRLLRSEAVEVPTLVGCRRPAVLLPPPVLERLSAAELDAVLAHELAHVRRHDFAANAVQAVADALLAFHPAALWISRRIREERELCCDELALRAVPGRLPAYLRALLAIDALRPALPRRHALAVSGGALLPRARRLAEGAPIPWSARSTRALLLGGGLLWAPAIELDHAVDLGSWAVMTLDLEGRRAGPEVPPSPTAETPAAGPRASP